MTRYEQLDRIEKQGWFTKGLNGMITCCSNVPKKQVQSGHKSRQSGLYAYPRKNNAQKANEKS